MEPKYYDRTSKAPGSAGNPTPFSKSQRQYMLPFNYNIPVAPFVAAGAACLSPNKQPRPCKEFLVQADYNNNAFISIGNSSTNLLNGLQLVAGQGWIFSIFGFGESSRLVVTPTNWVQGLENAQREILGEFDAGQTTLLNVADFYAASASNISQNLIVFFFTVPEVGR